MDILQQPASVSDESSCGDSSGPVTPLCSPLIHPVVIKNGAHTSLEQFVHPVKRLSFGAWRSPSVTSTSDDESVRPEIKNICFIGAGYVGGPTAAVIALHNPNIRITVVDKDERRIKRWKASHLPIHEPRLSDVVRISRDGARTIPTNSKSCANAVSTITSPWERQPNLFFTSDVGGSIAKAEAVFLAVNTSTKTFGVGAGRATDMNACDSATREIAAHARPGTIIIEKSTVPCGTARRIKSTLASLRPGVPFEIISNPEFLAEGTAIENLLYPDRVIIGSANTPSGRLAAEAISQVYAAWVPQSRILTQNVWSSELAKLVANAMLAQRISSINSISAICEQTGADVDEIAKAIGTDTRIGPKFLKAGLGFGGSCFRKDVASLTYLAASLGLDDVADYWDQVNSMNMSQHRRFSKRVIKKLDENLAGKKITILGFAFKPSTGDTRESLAIEVIKDLLVERPAEIAIFDPYCKTVDIRRELETLATQNYGTALNVAHNAYNACHGANAVIVATECSQFKTGAIEKVDTASVSKLVGEQQPSQAISEGLVQFDDKTSFELVSQPRCAVGVEGCPDCRHHENNGSEPVDETRLKPVDWQKVLGGMKTPRWIFDGRNVLDTNEIESFGISVNVESIGKRRR